MLTRKIVHPNDVLTAILYDGTNKDDVIKFLDNKPYVMYEDDKSLCVVNLSIYQSQTIVSVGDYVTKNSEGYYDTMSKSMAESYYVTLSQETI